MRYFVGLKIAMAKVGSKMVLCACLIGRAHEAGIVVEGVLYGDVGLIEKDLGGIFVALDSRDVEAFGFGLNSKYVRLIACAQLIKLKIRFIP